MFEDVRSGGHVHNVVDDELAEGRQQVPPLVERLDLVGLVLLVSFYGRTEGGGARAGREVESSEKKTPHKTPLVWSAVGRLRSAHPCSGSRRPGR